METNLHDKYFLKRDRGNGIGFAIFLILFGGIYLLLNLGVIPSEYKSLLISWQMLLIGIGIWSLIRKRFISGVILMVVGGFFIYPTLSSLFPEYFFDFDFDIRTYWPVILIIIGLLLVSGRLFPSSNKYCKKRGDNERISGGSSSSNYNKSDLIDKNLIFGSTEQIVLSQNFRGGEANVIFGEMIIDLRKAMPAEGNNYLEMNVAFASGILYLPSGWNVEIQSSTIMGSIEDRRIYKNEVPQNDQSHLTVKINCVLGGCEIRD